jgi:hypothetical protein
MPANPKVADSIDPALFLKLLLEHIGDFPGGILGSALNLAAAPGALSTHETYPQLHWGS